MKPNQALFNIRTFMLLILMFAGFSRTYGQLNAGTITPDTVYIPIDSMNGGQPITRNYLISPTEPTGGTGYTYQWQFRPGTVPTFMTVGGATNATLSVCCLLIESGTRIYRRVVTSGGTTVYTNTISFIPYFPIVPGTVSPALQTINFNASPGTLTASAATGGSGGFTYQWQSAPDTINWSNINGATSLTYLPPALIAKTFFRIVYKSGNLTAASKPVSVSVNPPAAVGVISPATLSVLSGSSPGQLTSTATGGNGIYTFQWQQSLDNNNWSSIPGATLQNYTPGVLTTGSYYYRAMITSNGVTGVSSVSTVSVYPAVSVVYVVPTVMSINYNTSPGTLALSGLSGGNGSYTYQWQSNDGSATWNNISGATNSTFTPGLLTDTMFYRCTITSMGQSVQTNQSQISVCPQLIAGSVTPTSVNVNNSATIIATVPSGGNGQYNYQWQYASVGTNWVNISDSTRKEYTTIFNSIGSYRMAYSSNNAFVYSNTVQVLSPFNTGVLPDTLFLRTDSSTVLLGPITRSFTIISTNPSGGTGGFTYQWQISGGLAHIPFSDISGANTANYSTCCLQVGTGVRRFRRKVTNNGISVYSNPVYVFPYQAVQPGVISPSVMYINGASNPDRIYGTEPSGGTGRYSYQWQSSTNGNTWTNISDATSFSYDPQWSAVSTFYRRRVISAADTVFSNISQVAWPLGHGGVISSNVATVSSGGNATLTSISVPITGACLGNFTFIWQASFDEIKWTDLAGPSVTPSKNTFYRRKTICSRDSSYSNTIQIRVKNNIANVPTTVTAAPAGTAISAQMPLYGTAIPDNVNYIRSRSFIQPGIKDPSTAGTLNNNQSVRQITEYFDELGRMNQTVAKQITPGNRDLISTQFYDIYGRVSRQYLPYSDTGISGNFRADARIRQTAFYDNYFENKEGYYYSDTIFEASPLNRIIRITKPGNSWTGNNKGFTTVERGNMIFDSVRIWRIGLSADTLPYSNAYYLPSTLQVVEEANESNNKTIVYKDRNDQIVLKKVQVEDVLNTGTAGWLCTYYVYDITGTLRFVIQPKATDWLKENNWTFDGGSIDNSTVAKELCFSFDYDSRHREIIRREPGAGTSWMVYDARDRIVMTQDNKMRAEGKWFYTDYDSLDRMVATGIWTTTGNRALHQTQASGSVTYPTPASGFTVLSQIYYDDYSWVSSSMTGLSNSLITANTTNNSYFYSPSDSQFPFPRSITQYPVAKGLMTGTKVNVLNTGTYLFSVKFYDENKQLIQMQNTNYSGGRDTLTKQYSFEGRELRTLVAHGKVGMNFVTYRILTKNFYDAAGRLTGVTKKAGNSLEDTVATYKYDELGRMVRKDIGRARNSLNDYSYSNAPLDSIKYNYNIQGWISGINRDFANNISGAKAWFGMDISYDFGFSSVQMNDNIAGIKWRNNNDGQQRAYGFSYDNANRIISANFTQNAGGTVWDLSAGIDYSVRGIKYDQNGNIAGLNQMGWKTGGSVLIDSLVYGYNALSNKLNYVTDKQNDTATILEDFKEFNTGNAQDYFYDENGNLIRDNNKRITNIRYNHLNLPDQVNTNGKGMISFIYDAAGRKLQKIVTDSIAGKKTIISYMDIFTYQYTGPLAGPVLPDTLQYIAHEEGRIRPRSVAKSDTMFYDFIERDHLGNTRVMLTDEKRQDVYPVATLENNANAFGVEKNYYGINTADTIGVGKIASWNSTPGNNYTNNNGNPPYNNNPYANSTAQSAFVYKLNGSTGRKNGLGITLKVMTGDVVDIFGKSFYHLNVGQTPSNNHYIYSALSSFISSFIGTPSVAASNKLVTEATLSNSAATTIPLTNWLRDSVPTPASSTIPRAYVNWILFDDQFRPVAGSNGFDQVSISPDQIKSHQRTVTASKSGYLYVYCSNESDVDVFFDNLQVIHTRGPLLETNDYYPFGLAMTGIAGKALNGIAENKKKFNNGTEIQNKEFTDGSGLEWYATMYRSYDPQIGRFHQPDLFASISEDYSPYAYARNNPLLYNDPLGLDTTRGKDPKANPSQGDIWYPENGGEQIFDKESGWTSNKEMAEVVVTPSNNNTSWDMFMLEYTGKGVGAAGTYYGMKGNWSHNELWWQQKNGKWRWRTELTRKNYVINRSYNLKNGSLAKVKSLSTKLTVVSGIVLIADVAMSKQIKTSHIINGVMTGLAFTGVGSLISGVWFLADMGTELFTGKSLSERIDESTGPLVDFND